MSLVLSQLASESKHTLLKTESNKLPILTHVCLRGDASLRSTRPPRHLSRNEPEMIPGWRSLLKSHQSTSRCSYLWSDLSLSTANCNTEPNNEPHEPQHTAWNCYGMISRARCNSEYPTLRNRFEQSNMITVPTITVIAYVRTSAATQKEVLWFSSAGLRLSSFSGMNSAGCFTQWNLTPWKPTRTVMLKICKMSGNMRKPSLPPASYGGCLRSAIAGQKQVMGGSRMGFDIWSCSDCIRSLFKRINTSTHKSLTRTCTSLLRLLLGRCCFACHCYCHYYCNY